MINSCPECLKKQREIDALKEENQRLKQKLRYQERKTQEGFFGSSTPSSKIPLKPNRPDQEGLVPDTLEEDVRVPVSFKGST